MKTRIFLALFLLAVAAFAEADATGNAATNVGGDVVVITKAPESELVTAPATVSGGSNYGDCRISEAASGGLVTVKAVCEITLPTPCHSVSYGWVPGKEDKNYLFSVQIMERPGVCTEVTQETRVENEVVFNYREGINFGYKINYVPVKQIAMSTASASVANVVVDADCENAKAAVLQLIDNLELQMRNAEGQADSAELGRLKKLLSEQKYRLENLECARQVVQKELPPASICVKERLDYEVDLKRLSLALYEAEEKGDTAAVEAMKLKIDYLRTQMEELPDIERCTEATQLMTTETAAVQEKEQSFGEYAERLRMFDLALRIANPCDKIQDLDDRIQALEQDAAGFSDEEAAAVKDKIGTLVDIKDNMVRACQELKDNSACGEAVQLRNRFRELVQGVENNTIDPTAARARARELLEEFAYLEDICLTKVKNMFDTHPCMAAQALGVELERLSATGENTDILGDIYGKIKEYDGLCISGQKTEQVRVQVQASVQSAGSVSDQASDVARVVGELELRKHLILADDTMPQEDKDKAAAELEAQKLELIKDALQYMKYAKIASGMNVKLGPDSMAIEDEAVDTDATLELPTAGENSIQATVGAGEIRLQAKKALVRARVRLDFENGMLQINNRTIKLPDELMDALGAGDGELELDVENDTPFYEGNVKKQFQLFAIIPISGSVHVKANAEDGQIIEMQNPWWAVLAV